jgi:hypothetical protein
MLVVVSAPSRKKVRQNSRFSGWPAERETGHHYAGAPSARLTSGMNT